MRNIRYVVEDVTITHGAIVAIGTRDKYELQHDTNDLKIFRYGDGRTVNEQYKYEIVVQGADDTDALYIKTNDIIIGVWETGVGTTSLVILRPVFRR